MIRKQYYSERHNLRKRNKYTLLDLRELFVQTYNELERIDLFEELIGYSDGPWNQTPGIMAGNFELFVFKKTGKRDLIPIDIDNAYTEEDIFDLIELFYDYVSKPIISGSKYDKASGQLEYRNEMNFILKNYDSGYELTEEGYIRELIDNGLENLIDSQYEFDDDKDSEEIVKKATKKFFHYNADDTDKKSAILEIAGLLENLRESNKLHFAKKDESDLFNLLNNFNLRHNNPNQQTKYEKNIFYPWVFFNLLSALDAALKLLNRKEFDLDF
ncbi:hypothetical protein [Bacillus amyloliquefaciens]|uniref:hypothetical protein n=1 Tax=Bacillus amyloliquefaciens TaxID=1390 RepID=UPI0007796957|nr:hypothetical protein [Bacillus amyloliquefaciens]KYC92458.1 hypothetical protein B425_4112 [Bacillus amyloliquefaciens]MEC1246662.1 hypothetical protein [Bacillus amyloliquefaciens]MEC2254551.1 hypothetical protein [Bacillus amyloliquefaciens]MED0831686.1 hypothetical protein [Bacillus amyloliquefaciens]MED4497544.1 hypothetical protein [Bacillus amyloliquefaciens]